MKLLARGLHPGLADGPPNRPARLISAKGCPSPASAASAAALQLSASVMSQAKASMRTRCAEELLDKIGEQPRAGASGGQGARPPPRRPARYPAPSRLSRRSGERSARPVRASRAVSRFRRHRVFPSSDNRAAIDQKVLPGDVARRVAEKEEHRVGHVDYRNSSAPARSARRNRRRSSGRARPCAPLPRPAAGAGACRPRRRD